MIAEVLINRNAKKLNRTFDYKIPKELEDFVIIGSKVLVPFGKSKNPEEAYVVGTKEKSDYNVKEIIKLEDSLSNFQIKLAKWMAKHYFCNVTDCIKLMQTPGTSRKENKVQEKKVNTVYLKKDIEEIEFEIETGKIKSEKQKRILKFVSSNEGCTIPEIEMLTDTSRAIVNTLVKNEYLEIIEKTIERDPLQHKEIIQTQNLKLTAEQQVAYARVANCIQNNIFKEFLLYGVTGSGKTEVYLQLIKKVLDEQKTAIVLVPEISLTPQMLDRFISRFGKDEIAVLHSKLSIGERHDEWKKIKER
ncbi:MAG: DEAD/DEAH box helicase family protein [Clostridia bacterium]|nr:DEAD/DEAH box helicase family protein [Clostridia bacterium]